MPWKYWDVAIAVAGFLIQCGLALLGLTLTHWKYKAWFAGLVLFGAVFTGVAVKRGVDSAEKVQAQLDTIQHNTEQPPKLELNMPPASPTPKQRAIVAFSRNTPNDGVQVGHDPQRGWFVNIYVKNVGTTVVASKVACSTYAETIPANNGAPTKQTLKEHWNAFTEMPAVRRPPECGDLEPGNTVWGSTFLQIVDPDLNLGREVIMAMSEVFYTDEAGRHKKELCTYSQFPLKPENPIWVLCEIGHNSEVY